MNTGSTLPGNLGQSQVAIIGDYVYLFGGYNGSAHVNVIYRAPISNPTAWVDTGSTLPGILGGSQNAIIGDYVYLFGGRTSQNPSLVNTNKIYRAPLANPLSWIETGSTLPSNLDSSKAVVINNNVYLFGGLIGSTNTTNVIYRAPIVP